MEPAVTLKHSRTHPKYLHSNSTSHKWAFGAMAELVDNAVDARAKKFEIDTGVVVHDDQPPIRYISCQDDGVGMIPSEVHRMMSFGHCSKVETDGQVPIGMYGNGFKSGSMRIGDDVLVFTKQKNTRTVGFLSQTFLKVIDAPEVIVPMATWNQDWKLFDSNDGAVDSKQSLESLKIIQRHSLFQTDEEIVEEFDKIEGDNGTRIVIMSLKRNQDKYEFNFEADQYDIQLLEERERADHRKKKKTYEIEPAIPPDEYSLRAYFRILYMNPRMKMYVRGKKVLTKRMLHALYFTKQLIYRPHIRDEGNIRVETRVVFGFTKEHKEHYGIMYYHKNRLISRYHKIGIMNTHGSRGVGVVGIIDCYFLTPTHNKQDFVYGDRYRVLVDCLKEKLRQYWVSCNIDAAGGGDGIRKFWGELEKVKTSGPFWIQCDNCLAWRRVRKPPETYPSTWICSDNTDKKYNNCKIPEEPDNGFPPVKIIKGKRSKTDDDLGDEEIEKTPKMKTKKRKSTEDKTKLSKSKKSTDNKTKKTSDIYLEYEPRTPSKRRSSAIKKKPSSPTATTHNTPPSSPSHSSPHQAGDSEKLVVLEDSIDDSLLDEDLDSMEGLKRNGTEGSKKRKASHTSPPSAKRAKTTGEPEVKEENTAAVSGKKKYSSSEKNLMEKLSNLCTQLSKKLSGNAEEFTKFGLKDWINFDENKFIEQVVKEKDPDSHTIPEDTVASSDKRGEDNTNNTNQQQDGKTSNFFQFL